MKWINHIIISGAATAIFDPKMVPVAILGATAPDWIETVGNKFFNAHIKHRQDTHYPIIWIMGMLCAVFLWDFQGMLFWFCFGGLSHCITDAMTVTGIPVGPWSDRRFHLFGGRFRTGDPIEYFIAFGFAGCCMFLYNGLYTESTFIPFFYNWGEYYETGLVSGSEWKENRFKIF